MSKKPKINNNTPRKGKKHQEQQRPDMDDTVVSLIYQGLKLVKDFESNLHGLANQPELLSKCCEDISSVFSAVRERVDNNTVHHHHSHQDHLCRESQQLQNINQGVQEWLIRSTGTSGIMTTTSAMENVRHAQFIDVQAVDASDSGGGSSSLQRPRKRREDGERRTQRVPAPLIGNTEIPPEDGYTWRKYGQKEILGSRFPRGYYRCTHQKLYHCPAKKQVQRLDNDPSTFEITYRGDHTCHMSSTAPSVPPPPVAQELITPEMTTQGISVAATVSMNQLPHPLSSQIETASLASWLEFRLGGGGGGSAGGSNSNMSVESSGAGPSSSRHGKEISTHDQYPVLDMADVLFNSGSSSTNSMDFLFHPTSGDHK